jgi:hypothetical protein
VRRLRPLLGLLLTLREPCPGKGGNPRPAALRRLRQRLRGTLATHNQAYTARHRIIAAIAFLDWLAARGLTLATCAQGDLDAWMATASTARKGTTGHFVRWARNRKHTSVDFPATRWNGPARTLDTEARWDLILVQLREERP